VLACVVINAGELAALRSSFNADNRDVLRVLRQIVNRCGSPTLFSGGRQNVSLAQRARDSSQAVVGEVSAEDEFYCVRLSAYCLIFAARRAADAVRQFHMRESFRFFVAQTQHSRAVFAARLYRSEM
jgi:hypothetical protein